MRILTNLFKTKEQQNEAMARMVDKALENLEQKRIEYANEVQALIDLTNEYEAQIVERNKQVESLLENLRLVKRLALNGQITEILDLLEAIK